MTRVAPSSSTPSRHFSKMEERENISYAILIFHSRILDAVIAADHLQLSNYTVKGYIRDTLHASFVAAQFVRQLGTCKGTSCTQNVPTQPAQYGLVQKHAFMQISTV